MTNDKFQMTKETRKTNSKWATLASYVAENGTRADPCGRAVGVILGAGHGGKFVYPQRPQCGARKSGLPHPGELARGNGRQSRRLRSDSHSTTLPKCRRERSKHSRRGERKSCGDRPLWS